MVYSPFLKENLQLPIGGRNFLRPLELRLREGMICKSAKLGLIFSLFISLPGGKETHTLRIAFFSSGNSLVPSVRGAVEADDLRLEVGVLLDAQPEGEGDAVGRRVAAQIQVGVAALRDQVRGEARGAHLPRRRPQARVAHVLLVDGVALGAQIPEEWGCNSMVKILFKKL